MSRIMTRPRYRDSATTGMKISEYIVIIIAIALLAAGARYYFVVYRNSPGYALGEYLAAIKRGDVTTQYDLIDNSDKREWCPRQSDYEKSAPQAHGYTERISAVRITNEQIDPNKPNLATVDAEVSIRKSGQEVYQADAETYTDHYKLRKDKDGRWKVWLKGSVINMLKAKPSPPGDKI